MLGIQGSDDSQVLGCGAMWFVYSLFLIKFIYCFLQTKKTSISLLVIIACLIAVYMFDYFDFHPYWAVTDIFIAMPFFIFGLFLKRNMTVVLMITKGIIDNKKYTLIVSVLLFIVLILGSIWNGNVFLYEGRYGESLFVMYSLAILGSFIIFVIAILVNELKYKTLDKWVFIISNGMIVILGFHGHFIRFFGLYIYPLIPLKNNLMHPFSALFTLLLFIPIILTLKKRFPIVLGGRFSQ